MKKEAVKKGEIRNTVFRQLKNFQRSINLLSQGRSIKKKEIEENKKPQKIKKLKKQIFIITDSIRSIEKALNKLQEYKKITTKEASDLSINWSIPNLQEEVGEYFENKYTHNFLKQKRITFKNPSEILSFLKTGKLTSITKKELISNYNNLTLTDTEFKNELKNPEYRKSYKFMEERLKNEKNIILPAPIIIKIDSLYYGFAGNRRMNLAFNYNIPLKVWLITKELDIAS